MSQENPRRPDVEIPKEWDRFSYQGRKDVDWVRERMPSFFGEMVSGRVQLEGGEFVMRVGVVGGMLILPEDVTEANKPRSLRRFIESEWNKCFPAVPYNNLDYLEVQGRPTISSEERVFSFVRYLGETLKDNKKPEEYRLVEFEAPEDPALGMLRQLLSQNKELEDRLAVSENRRKAEVADRLSMQFDMVQQLLGETGKEGSEGIEVEQKRRINLLSEALKASLTRELGLYGLYTASQERAKGQAESVQNLREQIVYLTNQNEELLLDVESESEEANTGRSSEMQRSLEDLGTQNEELRQEREEIMGILLAVKRGDNITTRDFVIVMMHYGTHLPNKEIARISEMREVAVEKTLDRVIRLGIVAFQDMHKGTYGLPK